MGSQSCVCTVSSVEEICKAECFWAELTHLYAWGHFTCSGWACAI